MEINDILIEWSYRLKKGYPTMEDGKFTDPSELKVLHEILKEYGFDEPLNLEAKKQNKDEKEVAQVATLTKDDLIANLSDPNVIISPRTIARINLLLRRNADFESAIEKYVKQYLTDRDESKSDAIVDILYEEGNQQDKIKLYLEDRTVSAADLSKAPVKIADAFAVTGLTAKSLGNLAVYKWNDTPRIGDLEVLLAILLDGGSRPSGAGDLAVNGQPCEVGGLGKRLTGQKGVNHPSMVQKAFVDNYKEFAASRGLLVDFVSVSGGAKPAPNSFHVFTGNKNYAVSQDSGWFVTAGKMNKELIELTKDSDDPITKQEVADLLAKCLAAGFTEEPPRSWDWVGQYMNNDGTLQIKEFLKEFAVFYFDYYLSVESEKREWFFLTNASQAKSAGPRDNFSVLSFEAKGSALRPHIFVNVGLTLPSYASNAGPQGVAFALRLGKVAGIFKDSLDELSFLEEEYYL